MEKMSRLLLAIGDEEIETELKNLKEIEVIDSDPDIEIITDILNYETVDFVILNTVLSEEKSLTLAKKTKEKSVKVICIIESHKDKEFIASLVGFGVRAFVQFDEIKKIPAYIKNYPEEFDYTIFRDYSKESGGKSAGIREKIFGSGIKSSGAKSKAASKMTGCRIVGIINAFPGAGATSLCVGIASYLSEQGKKVLILDRTENRNLSSIEMKGQDIDSCLLSKVNIPKYDYIIIDFGRLADIDPEGNIKPRDDMKNEKRMERQFCHEVILVGSSLPWKLFELIPYIDHPIFENLTRNWIFYINGEQNKVFDHVRECYEQKRIFLVSGENGNPYETLSVMIEEREALCLRK